MKKVEKQLWEMTKEEYIKNDPQHLIGDKYKVTLGAGTYIEMPVKVFPSGLVVLDIFGYKYFELGKYEKINSPDKRVKRHNDAVIQALSEGKSVSAEVLKDYPELKEEK